MPLFSFGQGLSYTSFALSCQAGRVGRLRSLSRLSGDDVLTDVVCSVRNIGEREGDDVLMVFHSAGRDIKEQVTAHPFPIRSLVSFERVTVRPGETKVVTFGLRAEDLRVTDENGDQVLYAGEHRVQVFDGATWSRPMGVVVQTPAFKNVIEAVPRP
jgi:beta-glucosidase